MAKLKYRTTAAGRGSSEQQAPTEQAGSRRITDEEQDDQDLTAVASEAGNKLDWRTRPVSRETNEKLKKLVGLMLVVLAVVSCTAGYISYTKCECICLWLITIIYNSYCFADNRLTTVPVNPPSTQKVSARKITKREEKENVNSIPNVGLNGAYRLKIHNFFIHSGCCVDIILVVDSSQSIRPEGFLAVCVD
jgi:hypothetical protein